MFLRKMKETINDGEFNESVTENGAVGYRTTGKNLLDLNFAVSSLRNEDEDSIIRRWKKAYYEDKGLALLWLFLEVVWVSVDCLELYIKILLNQNLSLLLS